MYSASDEYYTPMLRGEEKLEMDIEVPELPYVNEGDIIEESDKLEVMKLWKRTLKQRIHITS